MNNVFFIYINQSITQQQNLRIMYKLIAIKGHLIPVNLDEKTDIFMAHYIKPNEKHVTIRTIHVLDKQQRLSVTDGNMSLKDGKDDVQFVLVFKFFNWFNNFFDCSSNDQFSIFYGKFFITNYTLLDLDKSVEIYMKIDAFFTICSKKDEDFVRSCENDLNICNAFKHSFLVLLVIGWIVAFFVLVMFSKFLPRGFQCFNKISRSIVPA